MPVKDMTGQRFGRLTVIHQSTSPDYYARWLCQCDCKNICIARGADLRSKNTLSCGCMKNGNNNAVKHGYARHKTKRHPLYYIWHSMRDRCHNPNHPRFKDWGGRGITVCERWNDFTNFLTDVGERPPGTFIDRIDNDGDYGPGNIRWVTPKESANNRRPHKS